MRKFITPVSMKVTPEQGEEIIKELKKLGYNIRVFNGCWDIYPVIATCYKGYSEQYSNVCKDAKNYHRRYFIDHYNKELFLALAAMSEGDKFHPGEIVTATECSGNHPGAYVIGGLYKVSSSYTDYINTERLSDSHENGWGVGNFRRATKEEIINYFTKNKEVNKEFVLPEKWCVKSRTSDEDVFLIEAFESLIGRAPFARGANNYFYYPQDDGVCTDSSMRGGYTEITMDQFKRYVLKNSSKKIIGYKAPMDLFNGNYPKGTVYVQDTGDLTFMYKPKGCIQNSKWSLPKEIVETWEPVYEEEKLTFGGKEVKLSKMGSVGGVLDVEVYCDGERARYTECKKFRDAIETIARFKFGDKPIESIGGYHQLQFITKNKITIGCTTGTLEEIDKILSKCEEMLKS